MHRTNHVPQRAFGLMLLGLVLAGLASSRGVQGQEQAPAPRPAAAGAFNVAIGATRPLQMKGKHEIGKVENPNPDVATVQPAPDDNRTVLITGRQAGSTRITLTAADEMRTVEVFDVVVQLDVEFLRTLLQQVAPTASLKITPAGAASAGAPSTVVLGGVVQHIEDINNIMRVAESVVGIGRVINAMRATGVQMVQLDVVVASVSRSEIRRMNFDFLNDGGNHYLTSSIGGAVTTTGFQSQPGQPLTFTNTFGTPNAAASNVFLALFNDQQEFFGFLQLLRNENVAKLLAEPKLVVMSGRDAHFLAGGEQAVPSPGGLGAVSVQFVPFGTQVRFLPIVMGNGKIFMEVEPSISALNAANGVTIAGFTVQGRDVQRIHTTVEMEEGQTFVLGGLVQHVSNGATNKVPILGDLPFIGTAFSSKIFTEDERELVILVTPHLIDAMDCAQVPKVLPGQETRSPDDFELFLEGILEAPRGQREICPNKHYVPAYKNGPTAAVYPCGVQAEHGLRGCRGGICAGSGLAHGSAISYPGVNPTTSDSGTAPVEPAHSAELLPPVELNESAPAGDPPASENKPASLFGPAGYERQQ